MTSARIQDSTISVLAPVGTTKRLLALVLICLFATGCEVVGTYVMAVSGPECGAFVRPPELMEKMSAFGEQDQLDEAIALLERYEQMRNPNILASLAYFYLGKVEESPDGPELGQRIVSLLTLSALCGHGEAASLLGSIYIEGLTGVETDPALGACLDRVYIRHYMSVR